MARIVKLKRKKGNVYKVEIRLTDKALDRYELEVSSQKKPNTRAREITSAVALRQSFSGLTLEEITSARVATFRDKRMKQMVQRYTHLLDTHKLAAIDRIEGLGN